MKYIQKSNMNEAKSYQDFLDSMKKIDCHKQGLTTIEDLPLNPNIIYLECQHNELTSLKGVENLINLVSLKCDNNKLINLQELEKNTKIGTLECQYNKIISLKGIENLTELVWFKCDNNKLINLQGIENLIKLYDVEFQNNKLTSFELGDFSMDAFELGIDETDLRRFKNLHKINARKNFFSQRYMKYIREWSKNTKIFIQF